MNQVNILYLRDARTLYGGRLNFATPGSAGLDLRACLAEDELVIAPGERAGIPAGIAVEPLVGNRPSVCRVALQPSSYTDIRRSNAEVTTCPYCKRMLVISKEE